MAFSLDQLNTTLNSIRGQVNLTELETKATQTAEQFRSIFQSKGKEIGEIEQGFKVIADEGLGLARETLAPVVGKLSEDIAINLKKISTKKSDIATITGQAVDNGFLESAISNINTVGIEKTLKQLSNNTTGINSLLKNISGDAENVLSSLLNNTSIEGIAKDFVKEFTAVSNKTPDLITFLQNELQTNITNSVTGDTNLKSVIQNNFNSNLKSSELSENSKIVNSVELFDNQNTPDNYEFSFISTVEELLLEFRNSEREFSQIIVEYTGEYTDDNFEAKDFQSLYSSQEGFNGIPYHYLIRKDGRIQRGRPLDIEATYPSSISYTNAIVVAIPAGYNVPFGTDKAKFAINSGTTSSWYSFNKLLDAAYTMFPGIQVFASTELSDAGWSPDAYIESIYGKRNNKQPSSSSLTRSQVVSTRPL